MTDRSPPWLSRRTAPCSALASVAAPGAGMARYGALALAEATIGRP